MKTALELFLLTRIPDGFHVVKKVLDITQEQRDPDHIADDFIRYLFIDFHVIQEKGKYLLHSTSWRFEDPRSIILTYLAYSDRFSFAHLSPYRLLDNELHIEHSTNPEKPRPSNISEKAVVSHGIRHLAYLIATDQNGTFDGILSTLTFSRFLELEHQLAGRVSVS